MLFLEFFCTILSLGSAWASGSLEKNSWVWLFIASACNAILYYSAARYGHMALDLIYMVCALWGFNLWASNEKITYRTSRKEALGWIILVMLFITIFFFILSKTHSEDRFIDLISLVTGLIGIGMMALRRIEQWGIWIAHDLVNIALSMRAGLYLIALKQGAYLLLAIRGYSIWKNHLRSHTYIP